MKFKKEDLKPELLHSDPIFDGTEEYLNEMRKTRIKLGMLAKKKNPQTVLIVTAGCDIYPHGTLHKVLDLDKSVYPTFNESDRIDANWCQVIHIPNGEEMIIDNDGFEHLTINSIFGTDTFAKGVSLNAFRRLGYNSDGSRTGKFTNDEYTRYENYIMIHKLEY